MTLLAKSLKMLSYKNDPNVFNKNISLKNVFFKSVDFDAGNNNYVSTYGSTTKGLALIISIKASSIGNLKFQFIERDLWSVQVPLLYLFQNYDCIFLCIRDPLQL